MDSERPIEKLLRACAKKRRDEAGAPFELHPADRKVLQAEIERKFAKPKRSASFPQSLLVLVPRLVWGTAILAALAIIAFMLVPTPNKPDPDAFLAQNAPMPAEPQRHELSPTQVPALTEQLGTRPPSSDLKDLADKSVLEKSARSETSRSLSLFLDAPVSPPVPAPVPELKQPEPAAAPSPAAAEKPLSLPGQGPVLAKRFGALPTPSTTPVPSETPAPSSAVAKAEVFNGSPENARLAFSTKSSAAAVAAAPAITTATDALSKTDNSNKDALPAISQRFTQITRPTKAKTAKLAGVPTSTPVLVAFQVEQVGDELRIIDTDGSIYTGHFVAPEPQQAHYSDSKTVQVNRAPLSERSLQVTTGLSSALQNYSFRVTGTNRSMNQKIVFSGNLASSGNPASWVITNSVSNALGAIQNSGAVQNSNPLANSRISGTAQIGKGKEIQIEAISTP